MVNPDGSITMLNGENAVNKTPQQAAMDKEHSELDYLINSHPDRLADVDAARARRDELANDMGIDAKKSGRAFDDARARLRAKILAQQKSGPNIADIVKQQKQND